MAERHGITPGTTGNGEGKDGSAQILRANAAPSATTKCGEMLAKVRVERACDERIMRAANDNLRRSGPSPDTDGHGTEAEVVNQSYAFFTVTLAFIQTDKRVSLAFLALLGSFLCLTLLECLGMLCGFAGLEQAARRALPVLPGRQWGTALFDNPAIRGLGGPQPSRRRMAK